MSVNDEEMDSIIDGLDFQERVVNVLMGESRATIFSDTIEQQSAGILRTIARQMRARAVPPLAMAYLEACLDRYVEGAASLDEAFYLIQPKAAGGQPVSLTVRRATALAYLAVIERDTKRLDENHGEYIYSVPSKETQKEALQAALVAYRKVTGKIIKNGKDDDDNTNRKIEQTIKGILNRAGLLR